MRILAFTEFVNERCTTCDKLHGGLADYLSAEDIAKKHNVDVDEIERKIALGAKYEAEHTNDETLAREIAMDHLVEDPDYYEKLKKIEEDCDGGSYATLDSVPGMGEPILAGPGITGSGDVPGAYNNDENKPRRNKRKRSKRSLSAEDERIQFRRMERLRKFGKH